MNNKFIFNSSKIIYFILCEYVKCFLKKCKIEIAKIFRSKILLILTIISKKNIFIIKILIIHIIKKVINLLF